MEEIALDLKGGLQSYTRYQPRCRTSEKIKMDFTLNCFVVLEYLEATLLVVASERYLVSLLKEISSLESKH